MKLCQLEFYSEDVEASLKFAGEILGWKRVPVAIQGQAVIEVADDSPYGISIRGKAKHKKGETAWSEQAASPQSSVIPYFESSDKLSLIRERCLALGGIIVQEALPVTGYGAVMVVEDQGGLRYGLYEARFEGPRKTVKEAL